MSNEQILRKAIEKAIKNGYVLTFGVSGQFKNGAKIDSSFWYSIIYHHDFAKAFWGIEQLCCEDANLHTEKNCFCEYPSFLPAWKQQLKTMVLEENPIKYLEQFL